jgi:hypothetical protein
MDIYHHSIIDERLNCKANHLLFKAMFNAIAHLLSAMGLIEIIILFYIQAVIFRDAGGKMRFIGACCKPVSISPFYP